MDREALTCTCPNCRRTFRVLADEYGTFPCPHCGWEPRGFDEEIEREDREEEKAKVKQ